MLRLLLLCLCLCATMAAGAQFRSIRNDCFWDAADGRPIYSQGGGIFRFPDPATGQEHYYWYGVHYRGAETYRNAPVAKNEDTRFVAVTCYRSDNLVDWTFVGNVLTPEAVGRASWVGRMGVTYVGEMQTYALFIQCNNKVLVATCDRPTGPFVRHNLIDMTPMIGTPNTGDQTVFTDDDGRSYLVYSYGQGRSRIYLSEIGVTDGKVGLKDCKEVFRGAGREGNCMFKYKGRYYLCASDLYGWNASNVYFLSADEVGGPYLPTNEMLKMENASPDFGHVTQTGFFCTVRGSREETVVYCGDRWADFAGNGYGYNQWVPISFVDGAPHFNSLSHWELDAATGEWRVGAENNYVRNGSFEADRVHIPSARKPVQDFLSGWTTVVVRGNAVGVGRPGSPVLNVENSVADRAVVTGNFSLCMSDSVDFHRRVFQTLTSTRDVPLRDGVYTMRAQVSREGRLGRMRMYATANGKTVSADMRRDGDGWQRVELGQIEVRNGRVEIGFDVEGEALARCRIDDVELIRTDDVPGA